ncbi:hypothetical protein LY78DRAFT_108317 [Colletotrichum sublineola]|nr:hypothetical protein LY78DRAFT_108317 [Colletotrichum sublineola]
MIIRELSLSFLAAVSADRPLQQVSTIASSAFSRIVQPEYECSLMVFQSCQYQDFPYDKEHIPEAQSTCLHPAIRCMPTPPVFPSQLGRVVACFIIQVSSAWGQTAVAFISCQKLATK